MTERERERESFHIHPENQEMLLLKQYRQT